MGTPINSVVSFGSATGSATGTHLETEEESLQDSTMSSSSSEPRKFQLLDEIYDETKEVEIENELFMLGIDEPNNYKEAATEEAWEQAMKDDIDSIERNNTWQLVELPPGHKAVGLKWVYKFKRDANGEVIKYKSRLIAKGYVQKQGIDFEEVFASVT